MKIGCSLFFLVVVVQAAYCGVVEKNAGEAQKEAEVIAENEADKIECGLESANSPLLYDTNIDHPSLDGNSDSVKHKRCHHSYSRLGASLEPRAGIVGATAPQAKERRDVQNNFYTIACSTCLSNCKASSKCHVCEKWCSKAAGTDEPFVANNVVGTPQEIPPPEEPVMTVRSSFDDEKRKNVYTITTLKTGPTKELFMKVLGVLHPEDIDTVVIWVTTHSNHPPLISRDFNGELDPETEKAAEALKEELKSKVQKFHQNGKKFVKEGEGGMDNVIQNVLSEVHPKITGSKGVDNSQMSSRSDMASEMLPRYPIESEPPIVPQLMNPGIIEGPPNFKNMDGENEDLNHLEASPDQVEEGSISDGEQTLGVQQELIDPSVASPNPSLNGNEVTEQKESQPPEFSLRAGNPPELESLPLDSRPKPFGAIQGQRTSFRSLGGNEATGGNNLGNPLQNSVNEKFEALKKNSFTPGMERLKDQVAPGARLREFIDNMKANIVSSKNALPSQRKMFDSSLNRMKSGDLESGDDATLERAHAHHSSGKGHGNIGHHILHPHNHRSSSQDDNIGIFREHEKTETTTNTPDPGPLIQKLPLPTNITTVSGIYPPAPFGGIFTPPRFPPISRFSENNEGDTIVPENTDSRLGAELEENANSDNDNARSSKNSHGHSKGHGKGHHQGHGQGHSQGHGQGHGQGHHQGHGQGHHQGHGHRSSELGNPDLLNLQEERNLEYEPAEPATGDQFELRHENPENNPMGSSPTNSVGVLQSESRKERPVVPVKFNVGARANELIQKLKERQEMRKATLQRSPFEASRNDLGGFARTVPSVEPSADSGKEYSWKVGAPGPFEKIYNFDNAKAALGEVSDVSKQLQEITDTGKTLNTIKDENKKLNDGISSPEILGSQPLENSLERIQPSMSLSGRPWHNQNYANAFINEPKNEMVEEPSLGSANPDGDSENQNLNGIAGPETVGETNPDMKTRGQFEGEQNSFSNSMGAIVPAEYPVDFHNKPSNVYFLGNGIKLPMKMEKGNDGELHLSVDLDKLCSCNNITCPKNHTVLEKAVETILENEAELKEQLEPMDSVGKGIDPGNVQEDYGDMPLGMASPQGNFEDGPSDFEERFEMQPRIGAFGENAMEDVKGEQMALSHRNQRDTVEESRFLDRKNKIAGDFNSMELQSDNTGVLKRSQKVKAVTSGTKSLQAPMKKFVVTSTHNPHKPGFVQRQQNALLKNIKLNDGAPVLGEAKTEDTKTTLLSDSSTKTGESTIKTSSSAPNYLKNFMNKKLDDIKSQLEMRNEDMKKEWSFPEYFFKNLWAAGKEQADKITSNLNTNNPPPTLGSRLGSLLGKTAAVNNELYENLAPITKPYKFKALENQLKSNLEHIGDSVDNYSKRDDEILKEEVAALNKITENPVVRKEVGIVSNILKFFKELAADKNKRK